MAEWYSIKNAPLDGTPIQPRIPGHGSDNIIMFVRDFYNSDGDECGAWVFAEDQEPPDDWTDGACWEINGDGVRSTWPTEWKPLPESAP